MAAASLRRAATLAVTLLVTLTGCSGLSGTGDGDYVPGEGQVAQIAVEDREAPVEVTGTTLEGDPLDLADFRGDVTVVNVWWSGCGPCRSEMPMLVELAGESDAAFVGINIRDQSREAAQALERSAGVTYPSLYDPGSETLLEFGAKYSPRSMPSTMVLDREGRIAALISGAIPSKLTLSDVIEEVAAEDG